MNVYELKEIYESDDIKYKHQAKCWDDLLVESVLSGQKIVEVRVPSVFEWMLSIYCKEHGVSCRENQGICERGYIHIKFYGWAK